MQILFKVFQEKIIKFNEESQNNKVTKRRNVQTQCAMLLQNTDHFNQN